MLQRLGGFLSLHSRVNFKVETSMIGLADMLVQELLSPVNIFGQSSLGWLSRIYKRTGRGGGGVVLESLRSEN